MRHFAVIGSNVRRSLSPLLHSISFKLMGFEGYYIAYSVECLECFVKNMKGLDGFNVTIPYKEEIIKFLDEVRGEAREVGAVNTVTFEKGKTIGYNTDVYGFEEAIRSVGELGGKVVIIGAGGAARAAVYASLRAGATVYVLNRSLERAIKLANDMAHLGKVIPLQLKEDKVIEEADVIVNATPLKETVPFNPKRIKSGQVVMDMNYLPLLTQTLREAFKRGAQIVDGLKMLVAQGVKSEEIWIGTAPPWRRVYEEVLKKITYIQLP